MLLTKISTAGDIMIVLDAVVTNGAVAVSKWASVLVTIKYKRSRASPQLQSSNIELFDLNIEKNPGPIP